jgi:hypothetical protein
VENSSPFPRHSRAPCDGKGRAIICIFQGVILDLPSAIPSNGAIWHFLTMRKFTLVERSLREQRHMPALRKSNWIENVLLCDLWNLRARWKQLTQRTKEFRHAKLHIGRCCFGNSRLASTVEKMLSRCVEWFDFELQNCLKITSLIEVGCGICDDLLSCPMNFILWSKKLNFNHKSERREKLKTFNSHSLPLLTVDSQYASLESNWTRKKAKLSGLSSP